MKGSFTIEAAVVVPIILVLFVTVIHIAFQLHNQVEADASDAAAVLEAAADSDLYGRKALLPYKVMQEGVRDLALHTGNKE